MSNVHNFGLRDDFARRAKFGKLFKADMPSASRAVLAGRDGSGQRLCQPHVSIGNGCRRRRKISRGIGS